MAIPITIPRSPLQLVAVAPAELGVRDQAREDATPDEQLIASVRQHGIIQPPVIEESPDGGYVIVTGHRRVGAAIAAGLSEITCILRATQLDGDAITLEQQIVENERRKQLTAKDLVAGYQKLSLFGLRPEDIAAGLGEKPDRVRAALKVNASAKTTELLEQDSSIDLEQAAIIAEFDEHPKLQMQLIETATTRPENFARDTANARTQREVDARVATLKEQLAAEGVELAEVVAYDHDYWSGKGDGRTLERLGIRIEEHLDCPGHAAVIHRAQSYHLSKDPSEWILYVCTAWRANGHGHEDSGAVTREKTPEEIERAAQFEREQQARRDRQQLIAANRTARRTWLHGYITTGRLRLSNPHFDVMAASTAELLHQENAIGAEVLLELIDGTPRTADNWRDHERFREEVFEILHTGRVHSTRVAFAAAAAVFEEYPEGPFAVAYWAALAEIGYVLTDTDKEHQAAAIENAAGLITGPADDDEADEDEEEL